MISCVAGSCGVAATVLGCSIQCRSVSASTLGLIGLLM